MRERPILFSGPMVRAILEGRKTQTRRIVKPQPCFNGPVGIQWSDCGFFDSHGRHYKNKYGRVGDRLWVRETHLIYQEIVHTKEPSGGYLDVVLDESCAYKADWFDSVDEFKSHFRAMSDVELVTVKVKDDKWRPSIHMPRWASRIALEITGVRVERLQDISEEDAKAEGVENIFVEIPPTPANDFDGDWLYDWKDYLNPCDSAGWGGDAGSFMTAKESFSSLWGSINANRAPWESNPWVWAIEFKEVK